MPTCWKSTCTAPLVAQWQRRPTVDEASAQADADLVARNTALADAGLPALAPADIPPPDPATSTLAVHSCGAHAITMSLAQHIHQAACSAPSEALPGCACTPEPLPVPPSAPSTVTLPTGWVVPAG